MGVGGKFWDLLKPYARHEGVDFLRDKRVAVDLSFWIVQHDAAIRSRSPRARNPHLRTTFFRTLALFSKMGAYPVFVVDGEPSPLKNKARIERFFRMSGLDPSTLPKPQLDSAAGSSAAEESPAKQRNQVFRRYVRECVELLELLGMPVLVASGEAEALCAELNSDGHVDACLTADSDAFLFGARCVIKCLRSNSKEPFECYNMSEIEDGLGLRRKQMIAIALLVGNDHDLNGVPGFGVDTAVHLVQLFNEDEVLNRLSEIGKGEIHLRNVISQVPCSGERSPNARSRHCSNCGHPGSKKAHIKVACGYCTSSAENCVKKPPGFKCMCSTCDEDRKIKEQEKRQNWQIKTCRMISAQENFPNSEIINLYLCDKHGDYTGKGDPSLMWVKPNVESLVDFLTYHQNWEPSYIRQRMLPMLSTIYLREKVSNPGESLLLYDQYGFHAIERVKIRYGHPYYLVKWKRAVHNSTIHIVCDEEAEVDKTESLGDCESLDPDEPDVPHVLIDDGCWFLLTDENMDLVQAAFPKEVEGFLEEKRLQELRSAERKSKTKVRTADKLLSAKPTGIQLNITEFYRSSKVVSHSKATVDSENLCGEESPKATRKRSDDLDSNLPIPKSVRRKLLFD